MFGYGFVVAAAWLLSHVFGEDGTTISHPDSWVDMLDLITVPIFVLAQCYAGDQRARLTPVVSNTYRYLLKIMISGIPALVLSGIPLVLTTRHDLGID